MSHQTDSPRNRHPVGVDTTSSGEVLGPNEGIDDDEDPGVPEKLGRALPARHHVTDAIRSDHEHHSCSDDQDHTSDEEHPGPGCGNVSHTPGQAATNPQVQVISGEEDQQPEEQPDTTEDPEQPFAETPTRPATHALRSARLRPMGHGHRLSPFGVSLN